MRNPPTMAAWRAEFESELLRFPAGVHDDQVDAGGLVGQLLDIMVDGQKPQETEKRTTDGYRDHDSGYRDLDALTM
jgi:hypothetical protein